MGRFAAIVAFILIGHDQAAYGEENSWVVPYGNWSTGSNWSTGTVPSNGDTAYIDNNGSAQILFGVANASEIYVGNLQNGSISVAGGNLQSNTSYIGFEAASVGAVTVSGGSWNNSIGLLIGNRGAGTLTLTSSGLASISSGLGTLVLASQPNSVGVLNMGIGAGAGSLNALEVTGGSGSAAVNFNHSGTVIFDPLLTGSLSLTKDGSGTTILTGNDAYAGTTTILGGTLQLGNGGSAGTVSGDITNDSILSFNRSDNFEFAGDISGTGSLKKAGAGILRLTGNNSYSGGTTISGGFIVMSSDSSLPSGSLTFQSGGIRFEQSFDLRPFTTTSGGSAAFDTNGFDIVLNDNLSGLGELNKTGQGKLTLETSFQSTRIDGGTVVLGGDNLITGPDKTSYVGYSAGSDAVFLTNSKALTTGNVILGRVQNSKGAVLMESGTWTNKFFYIGDEGTGELSINGGSLVTKNFVYIGNNAGSSGSVRMQGGNWTSQLIVVGNKGAGTFELDGGAVSVSHYVDVGSKAFGELTVSGAGVLTIDSGDGLLSLGRYGGPGGILNIGAGATAGTLNALVVQGYGWGEAVNQVRFDFSGNRPFSPGLSGNLSVVKRGTGTLILDNSDFLFGNSYEGGTVIEGGMLIANNTSYSATGSGVVTVKTSGTLGGTGIIEGEIIAEGTLSPGFGGIGNLTTGAETWNGGGAYIWEIDNAVGIAGSNWDLLTINGTLDVTSLVDSSFTINLSFLDSGQSGSFRGFDNSQSYQWTIVTSDGISGFDASKFVLASGDSDVSLGGQFAISKTGNSLNLTYTPIPEPSPVWLLVLSLILGTYLRLKLCSRDGKCRTTHAKEGFGSHDKRVGHSY